MRFLNDESKLTLIFHEIAARGNSLCDLIGDLRKESVVDETKLKVLCFLRISIIYATMTLMVEKKKAEINGILIRRRGDFGVYNKLCLFH